MNNLNDISVAITASAKAGDVMMSFQKDLSKLNISMKGRFDLLTEADIASENAIIAVIKSAFPDDAILGEESGGVLEKKGRLWIIDPIDGTTNFSHGFPFFATSIALWTDGKPTAGVVFAPLLNELFTAEAGKGAFLNGKKIQVSQESDPEKVMVGTGFPYRDISVVEDYMHLLLSMMKETQGLRRPGSASLDLAYVASGRYGGFFEYALAPWDVAAGVLLIQEAGGVVSDWAGGQNWLEGKRIVTGNAAIHKFLLEKIQCLVRPSLWHYSG